MDGHGGGVFGIGLARQRQPVTAVAQAKLVFGMMEPVLWLFGHQDDDQEAGNDDLGPQIVVVLDRQRESQVVFLKQLARTGLGLELDAGASPGLPDQNTIHAVVIYHRFADLIAGTGRDGANVLQRETGFALVDFYAYSYAGYDAGPAGSRP